MAEDPISLSRRNMRPELPKRFYQHVTVGEDAGEYGILLDGRMARTPGKAALILPTIRFAKAVADEWSAQAEDIDLGSMPLTRLANTAIDRVSRDLEIVQADIVSFAGADLVCYRAGEPEGLAQRQSQHWDPVVAWFDEVAGGHFTLAEGVVHVDQPADVITGIRSMVAAFDNPFAVTALHMITTLTGSALLALAVAKGHLTAEEAWTAAYVDEDWNISQWGEDAEAKSVRDRRRTDYDAACFVLAGQN